jgi:hypothetical protein
LGQTKEEIKGKLYRALDRRDRAPNERNRLGKKSNSVFRDKTKRVRFGSNPQRFSLLLEGKERGEREEQNPSTNRRKPSRIWADLERETAARVRARRRSEVEDGPDMWAPHVSGWRRGRGAASAWAELGRARGKEEKEREVGPESAQRPRRIFKTFSIKIIREMMFHLLKILSLLK